MQIGLLMYFNTCAQICFQLSEEAENYGGKKE